MKRVHVILDGYFGRLDGQPASNHLSYENFWSRYAEMFDEVVVVTRVGDWEAKNGYKIAGPKVRVLELPNIRKLSQMVLFLPKLLGIFFSLPRDSSYIFRIPGFITTIAWMIIRLRGIPFGVEVVADPLDNLQKGAGTLPLRSVLKVFQVWATKSQCLSAAVSSYVTESALQRRYPPAKGKPTYHYTSLNLEDVDFVAAPKISERKAGEPTKLVTVGMMHQNIKGQDVLLRSIGQLTEKGVKLKLVMVGDGDNRQEFENQARSLNLTGVVEFAGLLPKGKAIHQALDDADLFVLPSRQEGLPRALLEAMARGLPSIASDVGGVGELLPPTEMVTPGDEQDLAEKIEKLIADPDRMNRLSAVNLEIARNYHKDKVSARRRRMYADLIAAGK